MRVLSVLISYGTALEQRYVDFVSQADSFDARTGGMREEELGDPVQLTEELELGADGVTDGFAPHDVDFVSQADSLDTHTGGMREEEYMSAPVGEAPRRGQKRTLHLLSMGRSGSCFLGGVMGTGRYYVFEPLNTGRSMWKSNVGTVKALNCMYDCTECSGAIAGPGHKVQNGGWARENLMSYCASEAASGMSTSDKEHRLVIKTVNLDDYVVLHDALKPKELAQTLYVQMIRDPRGVGAKDVCAREYLHALSAKEFLEKSKLPRENFVTIFFEHWSADVEGLVKHLHFLLGWKESPAIVAKAVSSHKESMIKWTKNPANAMREHGKYCSELMKFYGYPIGTLTPDYSALSDAKMHTPLTKDERAHLKAMRERHVGHGIGDGYKIFTKVTSSDDEPTVVVARPEDTVAMVDSEDAGDEDWFE